jgi:hypothetical protein
VIIKKQHELYGHLRVDLAGLQLLIEEGSNEQRAAVTSVRNHTVNNYKPGARCQGGLGGEEEGGWGGWGAGGRGAGGWGGIMCVRPSMAAAAGAATGRSRSIASS